MPQFVVTKGPDSGVAFLLADAPAKLGRNPDSSVVLHDESVSRAHAEVFRRDDGYYIRDLNSTHGTFVNGLRSAEDALLKDKDVVRVGKTEMIFHMAKAGKTGLDEPACQLPETSLEVEAGAEDELREDSEEDSITTSVPTLRSVFERDSCARKLSSKHAEMLSKVAEATQSVLDLDELFTKLLDALFGILEPDHAAILLLDKATGALRPEVTRPAGQRLRISRTIVAHAVEQRMSLLVSNAAEDGRFSKSESILSQSIRSAVCAPLVCRDEVLGVLYIDTMSPWRAYQEDDLVLVNIIASNAAVAAENAMLVRDKVRAERLAAMGTALAGVSHYIKNLLFGIHGSARLIEQGLGSDQVDVLKRLWPSFMNTIQRLSSIVRDMLTYSKEREPTWQPGNLNSLLRDVYESQIQRAKEENAELLLELDSGVPDSEFDPEALFDAILNVLGNAIEATKGKPDAQIVLRSAYCADTERVSVQILDNGPGVPRDLQEKIFEPFFSTKGHEGTGLGLAVARKTIEEHGGRLEVKSEPGQRTVFEALLPVRRF